MAQSQSKSAGGLSSMGKLFEGNPMDPIEFIYKENWLTLSSIGSIFTFGLVNSFRSTIFDRLMGYILPQESFEYMRVKLPDINVSPPGRNTNPMESGETPGGEDITEIDFGTFIRESIIWIFMTLLCYLLATFLRFPDRGGIDFNTKVGF